MLFRSHGQVLLGDSVRAIGPQDLISIPAWTWHQFRAEAAPLGFLCMVNQSRDKPQIPDAAALAALQSNPHIAAFLRSAPLPAAASTR